MKKRQGEAWMPADEFGRSLSGTGINLLVPDIALALGFQQQVLEAEVIYSDEDFAVIKGFGGTWMMHADHTYLDHPFYGIATQSEGRGAGIELRLYDADPDHIEKNARQCGYTVLQGCMDKPHGLRECYIVDNDGYVWVPSKAITSES